METRRLGRDGPLVSCLGLGGFRLAGPGGVETVRRAIEAGVAWIDTASGYADGESERVVGAALAACDPGRRPLVLTKCGSLRTAAGALGADLRPEAIRRDAEQSARRLGVETLDVLLVHRPDSAGVPLAESWGALARLADEGRARWIGLSNFGVADLAACDAIRHVDCVQPPLSLIRREAAADVLPWAAASGAGVVVYSPMGAGLLTGAFTADRPATLAPDDWRRRGPEFLPPRVERNVALRDALAAIGARRGVDAGVVAIAWTLAWPAVSAAIAGASRPEHVDGWIAAGDTRLSAAELDEIAAAVERTGAGAGPVRAA